MRDLNYQLKQLCRKNRDGSYRTQQTRERLLTLIANQLHELGYRGMQAHSLKPKHVEALVRRWQADALSPGTVKNRLSVLRWWAHKVQRQNVVARSNDHYGVPSRVFVTNVSRATALTDAAMKRVRDPHVRMSLELQAAFGLRREEAIKFMPSYAGRGDHLVLKPSWTKGGRARVLPIRHPAQREVLSRAHELAGRGSLNPDKRNYRDQLRVYERHTADAGRPQDLRLGGRGFQGLRKKTHQGRCDRGIAGRPLGFNMEWWECQEPSSVFQKIQDSRLRAKTGIGDFQASMTGWTTGK